MSQKYVIVHFVDVESVPRSFPMSEWPLHVTLLANFQTDWIEDVKVDLDELAHRVDPFEIRAEGEALFEPQQSVAVSLIRPDENIKGLHAKLLAITTKLESTYDEPMYNATGYRPHATIQRNNRLHDQQIIHLDTFTLVDMYPGQDIKRRQVIKTYRLGS